MVPLVHHISASAQRSVNSAVRLPIVALESRATWNSKKVEAVFVRKRRWPRPEDRGARQTGGYLDEVLEGCVTEGAVKQEK